LSGSGQTKVAAPDRRPSLAVFDLNVTRNSPAGSCILAELASVCESYDITVFSDRLEDPCVVPVRWLRVPLPRHPGIVRYLLFQGLALLRYLVFRASHPRPDIVQATHGQFIWCDISYPHFCCRAYLAGPWREAGSRGIRRLHQWIVYRFNAWTEARAFARARLIIVSSEGLSRDIAETYPATKGKIRRIPNWVDFEGYRAPGEFDRTDFRLRLGIAERDTMLLFVALGDFARKGLHVAIEAVARAEVSDAKLVVVGGGQREISRFRSLAADLEVSSQVRFTAFQEHVRPYYWAADLFIFPSIYENFSLATLQAAAAGLPVVTTKGLYGSEEFIEHGRNGWLVERDAHSIAEVIKIAAADGARRVAMGGAARDAAKAYDVSHFKKRWQQLLAEMVESAAKETKGSRTVSGFQSEN
jgi:glycosyltransferase involved in cell wall biosynthesis